MIWLILIAVWVFLLLLAFGLCRAASDGDRRWWE